MLPDNDAELRERVALLVKKGAARAAFAHLGPVDVRTGVGLEAQGLIDRQSGTGTVLDEDVIEVVTDRNSPRRNNFCPGPILFYRQRRDETKQFALDMTELLLSDHLNSRVGALDHFRLVTMTRGTMTSKTISILNSTSEDIFNPAPEVWRSAALGLYDAIRHDLLCIAAGARQSIEQHYEEGIQQYFPKLMRPAVLAIDGLGIPIVRAKELVPFATGLIQTIVESSSTFDDACDSYVDQVGFLPVAGSGSFSGFVQTWAEHRGNTVNLLAAVKAWKDRSSKPLAAFHACAFFLNKYLTIGEDEKDVHWQDFIELIARSAKDFVDDKCSVWKFHAELARHFCHYLEVRLPGSQADAIPRIAMWLANCVIDLIGVNEQAIAAFRNNGILSECYESEFNWRVANPPGIRSPLWIAIQGQAAIWAYALMVGLTTEEIREFRQFVKDDMRQAVERSFAVICVKDYVGHSDVTSLMSYEFERSFDGIAEAWIQEFGESDSLNSILSINSSRRRFSDASELAGALKSLAEDISEADKVFLVSVIDLLAKHGKLNLETVWASVSNEQWRSAVFQSLPEDLMEAFCTALASCLDRAPPKWFTELPHFYQSACVDAASKERADLLFSWIVLSSFHTYSVSAIERILIGPSGTDMAGRAAAWRSELLQHIPDAAPWTIARLRSVVASLSQ